QVIGTLSKGYRQRVGLATAILHRPSTLVLDEPTVGLDPKQIIAIRELIRDLGRQRTLLLSTHILPEVELLCNRVMIIDRGRIVAEGTPEELRERSVGNPAVRVTLKGAPDAVAILGSVPGVAADHPGRGDGGWLVEHTAGTDPREEIFRAAVARGWVLLEMARERTTLEDVFVRLTTHDQAGEAAAQEAPAETAAGASCAAASPAWSWVVRRTKTSSRVVRSRAISSSTQPRATAARKISSRGSVPAVCSTSQPPSPRPGWTAATPGTLPRMATASGAPLSVTRTAGLPTERSRSSSGVPSATMRPRSMIITRLQSSSTSGRMWVDRRSVRCRQRSRISSRMAMICLGSRPTVGSSRTRVLGR